MNSPVSASVQPDKAALRQQMKALRARLPLEERHHLSARVCDHLIRWLDQVWLPGHPGEAVAVYLATPTEINIDPVAHYLLGRGVPVAAPVVGTSGGQLTFRRIQDPASVGLSDFRIREPSAVAPPLPVTLIFVPGTAFTQEGDRLGMGQGWYDRTLAANQVAAGVAYSFQIVPHIPVEPHDRRMHLIATPDGITVTGA